MDIESLVRSYFDALMAGDPAAALPFFAPDVVQVEFPNRLIPSGMTRDLAALQEAAARGQQSVRDQRYEILNLVVQGNRAAAEVAWQATLNVPLGSLPAGGVMRARFGVFLELRDGRIVRQHNYDCFEPF